MVFWLYPMQLSTCMPRYNVLCRITKQLVRVILDPTRVAWVHTPLLQLSHPRLSSKLCKTLCRGLLTPWWQRAAHIEGCCLLVS